ncbi:hypothetical protein BS329_15695 [Amycolatopsis coloradensis]|uniref:Uncharacterized protein n=1 Tax=Amycolatopsis coloradensis TaxID=76021 RepID=A0A1R0KUK3_9PSEU|nr:hypothetical protein [Amycolatopsis coloradensis]OLZ51706.1 hypothetical protein BS329_15695 [Amycolatopsis coloradensis]
MNPTETIATYQNNGSTYSIDHLGIACPDQWGEFAVYEGEQQVAEFAVAASLFLPEHRPPLPGIDELTERAKTAVADQDPR